MRADLRERLDRIDLLSVAFTRTRPDLPQMSLDEFLIEHSAALTPNERAVGHAILALHTEASALKG